MKIIDITLPLSSKLVTSPTEAFFKLERIKTFAENGVNLSKLTLGVHNGTHIDAPLHFSNGGKGTSEIDPKKLLGPCQVLRVKTTTNLIEKSDIEGRINSERVLFKTTNSQLLTKPFTTNYIAIGFSAAEYLIEKKVKLVGIDYFGSEAKGSPGHPVHTTLLKNEIVIVEAVNLAEVEPGDYEIFVGALAIENSDGAPARILLVQK